MCVCRGSGMDSKRLSAPCMGVVCLAWDLFTAKVGNRSEARGRIIDFDPILYVLIIAKQHRMSPPFIIEARNWDDFGGYQRA